MEFPPPFGRRFVRVAVLLTIIAASATLWCWGRRSRHEPVATQPAKPLSASKSPLRPGPPPVVVHDSAPELSALISHPHQSEQERIEYVGRVIFLYRLALGSNPTGHNELVVKALLGENEKGAAFLPKDCPAIQHGELVDQWGTPYWFHSVSPKKMEIRSAGADKVLFTIDDVVPDV